MRSLYRSATGRRIIAHWCEARLDEWPVPHRRETVPLSPLNSASSSASAHLTFVGDGEPRVVFVPGTNFNAATCLPVAEALGARWPTVVVDMPGQPGLGSGERPRAPLRGWYGGLLARVLDALGTREAVVVGNSLGAAIALTCASERIAARVLYSPGGIVALRTDTTLLARSSAWLTRPSVERSRHMLELFTAPGAAPSEPIVTWMDLVARYCRSSLAPRPLPDAALDRWSDTPVVAAVGEHDRFLPPGRLGPAVKARLGRELRVLPGVGHLAVEERPGDAVALVEDAFEQIAAARTA